MNLSVNQRCRQSSSNRRHAVHHSYLFILTPSSSAFVHLVELFASIWEEEFIWLCLCVCGSGYVYVSP